MASGNASLLPDFVTRQGLVNPCLTRGADFEAYTGPMEVEESSDANRSIVTMIGSSTIRDLQGDVMHLSALDDMTRIPDNLTILLNHDMTVPDSIFGGLYGRPWVQSSRGIADLHLAAEVETSNPKAVQTYNMILRGRRLGCSIGCMVLDYDYDEEMDALQIFHVLPVEYSVVSVPANTRCWVEVAAKSLFERSLIDGRADDALRLAPAVKGMFWRAYDALVRHVASASLRTDLERVQPRETSSQRIMCSFSGRDIQFALSDTKGVTKALSREDVARVLEEQTVKKARPGTPNGWRPQPIGEKTADVCGNTGLPLMALGTEWTGSKAEKQIFAWAKNDAGDIQSSAAKQCFLWCDPDNMDKQSGYKMPFCYISGDSPRIVPLGVRACANVLSGGRGGGSFGSDEAAMKARVKTMYDKINSQLKPDPAWEVPWEKDDKAVEEESVLLGGVTYTYREDGSFLAVSPPAQEEKQIADSGTDAPITREDIGETPIQDDGTHAPVTGTHTHSHTDGQGGHHSHEHTHDGDADHGHAHAEKSAKGTTGKGCGCCFDCTGEPDCTCCENCAVQKAAAVDVRADGTHAPMTGRHTHRHAALGAQGGDETHEHEHEHNGDASHDHDHALGKAVAPAAHKGMPHAADVVCHDDGTHEACIGTHSHAHTSMGGSGNEDGQHTHEHTHDGDASHDHPHAKESAASPQEAHKAALLTAYNAIGVQLGFAPATLPRKALIPIAPDCSEQDVTSAIAQLDACADMLMDAFGIPDPDRQESASSGNPVFPGWSLHMREALVKEIVEGIEKALPFLSTMKSGREISAANAAKLKAIHDIAAGMAPGVCGAAQVETEEEAEDEARMEGEGAGYTPYSGTDSQINASIEILTRLTKALGESVSMKSLAREAVAEALSEMRREQQSLMQTMRALKNMPLGRPTQMTGRTVTPADETTTTYQELLTSGADSCDLSEDDLETVTRETTMGRITFKKYPAGYKANERTPLTQHQKVYMSPMDLVAYAQATRDVWVPMVNPIMASS